MLSVTIRQLEVLDAVTKMGGFGLAASQLGISQASVSTHITALETQVGSPVFTRQPGKRPELTDVGETVVKYAKQILEAAHSMEEALGRAAKRDVQRIVFSCQRSLALAMQSALARFTLQHPKIELVLRIGTIEDVIQDLRSGIADIGEFVSYDPVTEVHSTILTQTRLVVVAAPNHPLACARRISPSVLSTFPFVGPPPSMFGRALRHVLEDSGVLNVNVVAQTNEYNPLRELVLAGVGLTCSFWSSVEEDVLSGRLAMLDIDAAPMMLDVRLSLTGHRQLNDAAETVLEMVRSAPIGGKTQPPA